MDWSSARPIRPDLVKQNATMEREPPRQIGQYQIQRVLGTGGMATVYAALQRQPRRTVAVKVLRTEVASEATLRRFRREVEILGRLRHPCIAQVFEAGTFDDGDGSSLYLAVEYVPGAKTILKYAEAKQLELADRLKLFIKVCSAAEHAHTQRVIHRDLKPNNILVDSSGRLKLIDFGVAHAADPDLGERTRHTETGQSLGTIQYMSPEQVDATLSDIGPRSDVYALGVVLYEMLTGRHPYELEGLRIHEALRVILTRPPRPPSELAPQLHGDLETIILKALAKDPRQRYRDAGSMGRDILRFLRREPIHAKPGGSVYRAKLFIARRRKQLTVAGVIGAALVVTFAVAAWRVVRAQERVQQAELATQRQAETNLEIQRSLQQQIESAREAARQPDQTPFRLAAHDDAVSALTFDPTGRRLVSASHDGSIAMWDLAERSERFGSLEHEAPVTYLAVSGDGSRLAAADEDGLLVVYDAATGDVQRRVRVGSSAVRCLALDYAGDLLAVGRDDLTISLWATQQPEPIRTFRGTTGSFRLVAFSPDGLHLAAVSETDAVYAWDIKTAQRRWRQAGPEATTALGFNSAGDRLLCVSLRKGGTWFDPATGDAVARLSLGRQALTDAALDPTGQWLAAVVDDRTVRVWNLVAGEPVGPPITSEQPIQSLAIHPEGTWLALGEAGGDIVVVPVAVVP